MDPVHVLYTSCKTFYTAKHYLMYILVRLNNDVKLNIDIYKIYTYNLCNTDANQLILLKVLQKSNFQMLEGISGSLEESFQDRHLK